MDVCWASSSSPCWPTTAHRRTTPTFSSSLRTTQPWWVSSATTMRQTTGVRWAVWPHGAGTTVSPCGEEKRDCCRLQESAHPTPSSDHQWCCCGKGEQHQVPGCAHLRGSLLDHQHLIAGQEGSPTPPLPLQTEKRDDREHPIKLHHGVVWCLHCLLPQIPSADCESSGEEHRHLSPPLQELYNTRLTRKAIHIAEDPTHPSHSLFSLLPSGRKLSPGQDQPTEGQLFPSGCQSTQLPPCSAPFPQLPPSHTNSGPWPQFYKLTMFTCLHTAHLHNHLQPPIPYPLLFTVYIFTLFCVTWETESHIISITQYVCVCIAEIDNKAHFDFVAPYLNKWKVL